MAGMNWLSSKRSDIRNEVKVMSEGSPELLHMESHLFRLMQFRYPAGELMNLLKFTIDSIQSFLYLFILCIAKQIYFSFNELQIH